MLFTDVIPEILVTKTADQSSVDETGELVTFTVTVENDTLEPVTVDSLDDDVYGDLTQLADSTCVAGAELEPDDDVPGRQRHGPDTYTCTFTVLVAQLAAELQHKDTVTVTVHDNDGNSRECGCRRDRHVRPHPAHCRTHEAGSARRERDGRRARRRRSVHDHHDQHVGRAGDGSPH